MATETKQGRRYLYPTPNQGSVVIFVADGISRGKSWMTFYDKGNKTLKRLTTTNLPERKTRQEAQADLDRFASLRFLLEVDEDGKVIEDKRKKGARAGPKTPLQEAEALHEIDTHQKAVQVLEIVERALGGADGQDEEIEKGEEQDQTGGEETGAMAKGKDQTTISMNGGPEIPFETFEKRVEERISGYTPAQVRDRIVSAARQALGNLLDEEIENIMALVDAEFKETSEPAKIAVALGIDIVRGRKTFIVAHIGYSLGKRKSDTDPIPINDATPDLFGGSGHGGKRKAAGE